MPDSEDILRTALRELADQAGPPRFPAGPLIRRAARRRARFAAATGCCALAVAAAAVAIPVAMRGQSGPVRPAGPSATAVMSTWDTPFVCGQALPPGLPGATAEGVRITIDSVTRSASGAPEVIWSVLKTGGPLISPVSADLLVVRAGKIFAAEPAPSPGSGVGSPGRVELSTSVPPSQVYRYAPVLIPGTMGSWTTMWQRHQDYRVVIVATVWTERGTSPVAVRLSVSAALPAG